MPVWFNAENLIKKGPLLESPQGFDHVPWNRHEKRRGLRPTLQKHQIWLHHHFRQRWNRWACRRRWWIRNCDPRCTENILLPGISFKVFTEWVIIPEKAEPKKTILLRERRVVWIRIYSQGTLRSWQQLQGLIWLTAQATAQLIGLRTVFARD